MHHHRTVSSRAHVPNGIPPGITDPPPSPAEPDTPIELPHEPPPDVVEPPVPTELPPVQEPPMPPGTFVSTGSKRHRCGPTRALAHRLP